MSTDGLRAIETYHAQFGADLLDASERMTPPVNEQFRSRANQHLQWAQELNEVNVDLASAARNLMAAASTIRTYRVEVIALRKRLRDLGN